MDEREQMNERANKLNRDTGELLTALVCAGENVDALRRRALGLQRRIEEFAYEWGRTFGASEERPTTRAWYLIYLALEHATLLKR